MKALNVESYLHHYGIPFERIGRKHIRLQQPCVFDPSHDDAPNLMSENGLWVYHCWHCEKSWCEFQKAISGEDPVDNFYETMPLDGESAISLLNERHAVVSAGGKTCILNEKLDSDSEGPCITLSRPGDFKTRYGNEFIEITDGKGNPKQICIADYWLKSSDRRQYESIVFNPCGRADSRYYNLWCGFGVEPKPGNWPRMREHIFEIVCNGGKMAFDYLMAWMARIVQDPGGTRPGVAIVLKGPQGSGKGIFVTNYGKKFGPHFRHLISSQRITSRFNVHLQNALLVFADEAFWTDKNNDAVGCLRGLITEQTLEIEPKNIDPYTITNHVNLIMASNSDHIVPAALDDRRFFVLEVSGKRCRNFDYFKAINDEMESGGREAMLHDLLSLDISKINLRIFPRTSALLDQMLHSMPPDQEFWYQVLRDGGIYGLADWPECIRCDELHRQYMTFSQSKNKWGRPISQEMFGKAIRKLCPDHNPPKKLRDRKAVNGTQSWYYFLPPLDACRRHFGRITNISINWEE